MQYWKNIVWLALALICSCTYIEPDTYYVKPVAGDPAVITLNTSLDTIENPLVRDSLEVTYGISVENGELYELNAFVHHQVIYSSDSTLGSFWIYSSYVPDPGTDSLLLEIIYPANTNSLADVLGLESLVFQRTYTLLFE